MTVTAMAVTLSSPVVATTARAATRARIVFEGRERGCRALAELLRARPDHRMEVELVALAVPRVPGSVRLHLGDAAATEQVIAAARGALEAMETLLAREGIACRTRIEVGALPRAMRAALHDTDADLDVVAIGWPRWRIAWLARRQGGRTPPRSERMIVV